MRKWMLTAAMTATAMMGATGAAWAEDGEEGTDVEPVVYGQRGITLAKGYIRPEGALALSQAGKGADTAFSILARVDWAPIDKLEIGVVAGVIGISPDTDYGDTRLSARYKLLDGGTQLAVDAGFTFSSDTETHGHAIDLSVPLRFFLNNAARLDLRPGIALNLAPDAGGDATVDLQVALGLAVSLTRNLYLEAQLALVAPEFKFDNAVLPFSLEVGWAFEGDGGAAFVDAFLHVGFPAFVFLGDAGDTFNLNPWQIGLGARLHFALE